MTGLLACCVLVLTTLILGGNAVLGFGYIVLLVLFGVVCFTVVMRRCSCKLRVADLPVGLCGYILVWRAFSERVFMVGFVDGLLMGFGLLVCLRWSRLFCNCLLLLFCFPWV